ncbi:MAG TPA: ArsA-related P-loop ATPase [Acidimicrobiales bacterium]|nr:ArsA-related P-loop ATPase [Acidimicrobiales bacterium]
MDRRLLVVTGKGGTGKSTIAAALALLAAESGKKTLLVSVDAKNDLAEFLEVGPLTPKARTDHPGLWALALDPEESLREYIQLQLRVPLLSRIGPLSRIFEYVATAAPGVREVVTVGKILFEVKERDWDLVVVDGTASGHVIGQLAAPQAINELVHVGLIRSQTAWMIELLSNPETTGAVIVATPEEMPVSETIELTARLRDETPVELAAVVANRVLPELFGTAEEALFEELVGGDGPARLAASAGGDPALVVAGARLAVDLRRNRAIHLERLRRELDPDVPLLYVPYLFTRTHGLRATRQVLAALSAELGT